MKATRPSRPCPYPGRRRRPRAYSTPRRLPSSQVYRTAVARDLKKIGRSRAIVVETAQNSNCAIFPLKSKAKKFDGLTVGFRPSAEKFRAYKSARYDALRRSNGSEASACADLSHRDDDLAFRSSCLAVGQSVVCPFEWEDTVQNRTDDPGFDERRDLS
jgi:hypothetical protein